MPAFPLLVVQAWLDSRTTGSAPRPKKKKFLLTLNNLRFLLQMHKRLKKFGF